MKIEIPDGFFPPPGVPFETDKQKRLAVAMNNAGLLKVQYLCEDHWRSQSYLGGELDPLEYRIAPPATRTVGPFESHNEHNRLANQAFTDAWRAAVVAGFKNFRIHLTATAEEIL